MGRPKSRGGPALAPRPGFLPVLPASCLRRARAIPRQRPQPHSPTGPMPQPRAMGGYPPACLAIALYAFLATYAAPLDSTIEATLWATTGSDPSTVATTSPLATMDHQTTPTATTGSKTSPLPTTGHQPAPVITTSPEPAVMTASAPSLALMAPTSPNNSLEATTGHHQVSVATTGHQLVLETTNGQQPAPKTTVTLQSTLETTTGHHLTLKATVAHQTTSRTSIGYLLTSETTMGHQPALKTSTGRQPAWKTPTGHRPASTAITSHQPAPKTTTAPHSVVPQTLGPPAPHESSRKWLLAVVATVAVLVALGLVVAVWLRCRRHRSGSTSFGPWAGPAQLPEDDGCGGAGPVTQPLVDTVATGQGGATLSTFQATSDSVAMEELPDPRGDPPVNGDPGVQGTSPPSPK